MRNFLGRMIMSIKRLMYGRYGIDELSRAIILTALGFLILSYVPFLGFSYVFFIILALWAYIRAFSKNIAARRAELAIYMNFKSKFKRKQSMHKKIWDERKEFKYFRCKGCKSYWRVPRGRGRVEITCRNCKMKMQGKT